MRKICIYGGSFDPVHKGHVELAMYAKKELSLDEVIFLPAKRPPHKMNQNLASAHDRYEMLKLAVNGMDGFSISKYELEKEEISYSYLTLSHFKEIFPDDELYFLMGADSLRDFVKWKRPDVISNLSVIVAAEREDIGSRKMRKISSMLKNKYGTQVKFLRGKPVTVSSHEIRKSLSEGGMAMGHIDDFVLKYIRKRHLYGA